MTDGTKIEWTDATWNPTTGCDKVSPGCDHCYAESIAHRFAGTPAYPDGFAVTLRPERLSLPLRWKRPRRVFVNSMSDLFHADIPDEYICQVFDVMLSTPRHTFQVLTKRHARMRSFVTKYLSGGFASLPLDEAPLVATVDNPPANIWLGVSVEDQKWADIRIPALLDTPAAVRFLSCEPLLGPVNLDPWRNPDETTGGPADRRIDWVIVGGESGPGARPMAPAWAQAIRDQCVAAGVPMLFKQWGSWGPTEYVGAGRKTDREVCLPDSSIAPRPSGFQEGRWMKRMSKHTAGRELDGRTWDEYPADARTVSE